MMVDLADALAQQNGVKVSLMTQAKPGDKILENASDKVHRTVVVGEPSLATKLGISFSRAIVKLVQLEPLSLIHSHGLWLPVNYRAAQASRKYGVPLVIQPHGMLEPWALAHKALKKRIAMALFQRNDLRSAKLLVASSPVEFENLRQLGFRQPIAIIPNGVAPPVVLGNAESVGLHPDRNRVVLFLSRIHPVKGVVNLLKAWATLAPVGWTLRIAGPDEGGHLAEVTQLIEKLRLHESVEYVGEADAARKAVLYQQADLFVLPTFSENFGVVVAEALSYGVPVITTRSAPWADLETFGCGWWVETGVAPLVAALGEAMMLDDAQRSVMGGYGRAYVQRYDWPNIASQTAGTYRWLLGHGAKPECVQVG